MNEKDLEGKICPIDETQLEIRKDGGWEYIHCRTCNAVYEGLDEKYLIEKAKQHLQILKELNEIDKNNIKKRKIILEYGKGKGLI